MVGHLDAAIEDFVTLVKDDVFAWCQALNFVPTWQQWDVLEAYQSGEKFIGVKSGQGSGKTRLECVIASHWMVANEKSKLWVTAPAQHQLKGVWMSEFRLMISEADPIVQEIFHIRTMDIICFGDPDWKIECLTSNRAETFQGRHNKHAAFIIDEGSGIPSEIYETIFGTLTNTHKLLLVCGNPNKLHTPFHQIFTDWRDRWWTYTINTELSPICDWSNIQRLRETFGEQSDVYRVRVLGEFPDQDPAAVMSIDDLERCLLVDRLEAIKIAPHMKRFGIDFARFGNDSSVVMRRTGNALMETKLFWKTEPDVPIAHAFQMQNKAYWNNDDCLFIADADGMGQGLMHIFKRAKRKHFEFHSGATTNPRRMYHDFISEAFFTVADLVKSRSLHIPKDTEMRQRLFRELSTRQFDMTTKGQLKVEDKKEYKKRVQLEQSPDMSDAFVMAFYENPRSRGRVATSQRKKLEQRKLLIPGRHILRPSP